MSSALATQQSESSRGPSNRGPENRDEKLKQEELLLGGWTDRSGMSVP